MGRVIAAGVLAIHPESSRILMGRRSLDSDSPNTWCIFGGTYDDKDTNPRQTAIREFEEETKCTESYQLAKEPIDIYKNNHLIFYTYIGLFDNLFEPELDHENLDYGWFGIDNLPSNIIPGLDTLLASKLDEIKSYCTQKQD